MRTLNKEPQNRFPSVKAFAQELGDQERWQKVWQKLKQVVQWDGLFSEAIHEETGQVESRHWFSRPGAFLSTILLALRIHQMG